MHSNFSFRAAIACVLLGSAAAVTNAPAYAQQRIAIDIPAQSAAKAITKLGRLTGTQILFDYGQMKRIRSNAVKGTAGAREALQIMLRGTAFEAVSTNSGAIVVRPIQSAALVNPEMAHAPLQNESDDQEGPEILVTGTRYQFLSVDTSGATNLPLPIEKVPQSISLISEDFINAADLDTLGEIAQYTAGATYTGNRFGLGTNIKLRGFFPGRAIDGINIQGNSGFEPDYAIVDRLEIVKGPASVVYGVSSAGGLTNFVTKGANSRTPSYVVADAGMWDNFRLEGQFATALDADGKVRAIGVAVHDRGKSFMNQMEHRTTTLYGGLDANLGDVTAYLHGGYQVSERTSFDGIPTFADGSAAPLPRSFFIGSKNLKVKTPVYFAVANVTWHASDMLDITLKGNFETRTSSGAQPYASRLQDNGDVQLSVQNLKKSRNRNYGLGLSAIYKLDELGMSDSFVSLAALHQAGRSTDDLAFSGSVTGNIFDGEEALSDAFETLLAGDLFAFQRQSRAETTTLAAQSVLEVTDKVSALFGASYSSPKAKVTTGGSTTEFDFDNAMSYRAGLIYEVVPTLNAYISYSESFSPQTLFDVDNDVLPPIAAEQFEGGLKYRSTDGRLLLTGAVYRIVQSNQGKFDQNVGGVDYYKPVGELTHKGIELEATGQLTPQIQLRASYAYLDAKVTADPNSAIVGKSELFVPKHTASAYGIYTIDDGALEGLSFGGGARHVSAQRTSYTGSTLDMSGYWLADAMISYEIGKWLVQLNARNIFDKHYFINNYETLVYGNVIGEPANVSLSVRLNF